MSSTELNLNDVFGSVLIGSWFASMAYAVVLLQAFSYFRHFTNYDWWWLKMLVAVTVFLDTVSLAGQYAYVYLFTVTLWGQNDKVGRQYWPVVLWTAAATVVAPMVNSFLVYRFYALSRNTILTIMLALLVLLALGGGVYLTFALAVYTDFADREKAVTASTIYLASYCASDFFIAAGLLWQLSRMRTSFQETNHLIHQLMRMTLQSGMATFLVSLGAMVAFLANVYSNSTTAMAFLLSHFYSLTLLYNLNVRSNLASDTSRMYSSTARNGPHYVSDLAFSSGDATQHQTVLTDPERGSYNLQDFGDESKFHSDPGPDLFKSRKVAY